MADDPTTWGAVPVDTDGPESWGAVPVGDKSSTSPKPDFSWSQALTDIPSEIYKEGATAAGDIGALADRGSMGPVEGALTTGKAVAAVPRLLASPFTGAVRSVLGHGMTNIEHGIGSVINPKVAAQDNPQTMYETAKGDVDKALMAARPAGGPVRIPAGPPSTTTLPNGATMTTQPRMLGWQSPVAPSTNVPIPDTVGDFGVPLTEGEAAGSMPQIAAEQRALRGGEGTPAQRVAQARIDARNAQLAGVREDIGRTFDPYGGTLAETPYEAGDVVQRGVQTAAQSARDLYNQRYTEMRSLPGEFSAGAFEGIGQRVRGQLTLGDNPVIVDDRTTPVASQMLRDVDQQIGSLRVQNNADPFGAPNPENITAVNLQGVDQARKRLVSMYKDARAYPPTADTRAAQAILKAFDDQVENSITQGLFSGDERALDALREARGAYSTYRQMFSSQGSGDDVGRAMQHILGTPTKEAASPTQMANYLYGTANVGASGLSFRLALRLRDVLGEASPEWSAVKQGLWQRLTERPDGVQQWGPQQVSQRIAKFLNGDGAPLANRVFNPVERSLIQRYGDLMQRMVPPPGAVNYSNNLQWASHFRDQAVKYVSAFIGDKLGGPVGGVVGYGIGAATQPVVNIMKARKVVQAMPTVAESMQRWDRAVRAASRQGLPNTPTITAATNNLISSLRRLGISDSALGNLQGPIPTPANQDQQQQKRGGRIKRRAFDEGGEVGEVGDVGGGTGDVGDVGELGGLGMGSGASIGDVADGGAMAATGDTGVGGIGADPSSGSGSAAAISGGDAISGNASFGGQLADQGAGGAIGSGPSGISVGFDLNPSGTPASNAALMSEIQNNVAAIQSGPNNAPNVDFAALSNNSNIADDQGSTAGVPAETSGIANPGLNSGIMNADFAALNTSAPTGGAFAINSGAIGVPAGMVGGPAGLNAQTANASPNVATGSPNIAGIGTGLSPYAGGSNPAMAAAAPSGASILEAVQDVGPGQTAPDVSGFTGGNTSNTALSDAAAALTSLGAGPETVGAEKFAEMVNLLAQMAYANVISYNAPPSYAKRGGRIRRGF